MSTNAERLRRGVCYLARRRARSETVNPGKAAGGNGVITGRKQQIRTIKKINQLQRCKAASKGKQEGDKGTMLGFSQAVQLPFLALRDAPNPQPLV